MSRRRPQDGTAQEYVNQRAGIGSVGFRDGPGLHTDPYAYGSRSQVPGPRFQVPDQNVGSRPVVRGVTQDAGCEAEAEVPLSYNDLVCYKLVWMALFLDSG